MQRSFQPLVVLLTPNAYSAAKQAFDLLSNHPGDALGVIFTWDDEHLAISHERLSASS